MSLSAEKENYIILLMEPDTWTTAEEMAEKLHVSEEEAYQMLMKMSRRLGKLFLKKPYKREFKYVDQEFEESAFYRQTQKIIAKIEARRSEP